MVRYNYGHFEMRLVHVRSSNQVVVVSNFKINDGNDEKPEVWSLYYFLLVYFKIGGPVTLKLIIKNP